MSRLRGRLLVLCIPFLLVTISSCQQATPPTNQQTASTNESKEWDSYVNDFIEANFVAHPEVGVHAGRHEFDGKLTDFSAEGIASEIKRLHAARDRVAGFQDSTLNERQRFERDYVAAIIDGDLFWLESAEWPFRCPQFYADSIDPDVYVSREYAPLDQRLRAYTAYAKSIPIAVEQIRKNLRTPMPRSFVKIGHTTFGGLISFYQKDVPGIFASVKDEQLQKDFQQANDGAIKAMQDIDAWFTTLEASATTNFQLGPDKFSEMLKATERVDVPLDKLAAAGRQDLQRNLDALKTACASYAPGKSTSECVAQAQAHKPEGGAVFILRFPIAAETTAQAVGAAKA